MDREKILIVVLDDSRRSGWSVDEEASEMNELVNACGGHVVDHIICRFDKPSAATLIGSGKVKEIADFCDEQDIETVVFSQDLKGSQQRNLEEKIGVKTIDHTQLILDIFARRAETQEGKMQVELAQLEYLLPRLVGQGIALSRLGGGIGTLGPGETKLEVDRRRIAQRITRLKRDLREVEANRDLTRKRRKDKGIPLISIVGYTNAGKSTLLNTLTGADQVTRDGLFTSLASLSRQYILPNNQKVVLSDTVGFMHNLPHHLVEAFKATLEEVHQADLLLHVLDISNPNNKNLHDAVMDVLAQLDAVNKPIITVLNKIDRLTDKSQIERMLRRNEDAVAVSAKKGDNLSGLFDKITEKLTSLIIEVSVTLPISRMDLVSRAHSEGQVFSVKYYNDTVHLRAAVPKKLAGVLERMHQV